MSRFPPINAFAPFLIGIAIESIAHASLSGLWQYFRISSCAEDVPRPKQLGAERQMRLSADVRDAYRNPLSIETDINSPLGELPLEPTVPVGVAAPVLRIGMFSTWPST